jgi:nicotinamidase-related amidase
MIDEDPLLVDRQHNGYRGTDYSGHPRYSAMPIVRLTAEQTVLLVVDFQPRLLPHIDGHERMVERAAKLIRGCCALDLPILATEQYPAGLGHTIETIRAALPPSTECHEKLKFSACIEPVRRVLAELGRPHVLICGLEAHVCVMQTALDLAAEGYLPVVAVDAIGSREATDLQMALRRMEAAGVTLATVEMALLEMVQEAGTSRFKAMLPIVK